MSGLVKLRCSGGHLGERQLWAEVVIWQSSMGIELTSSQVKVFAVCCTAAGICSPNVLFFVVRCAERWKQSKE